MKFKLTKDEKNWILYDVGNSAFTLLITTIMPVYFNSLAGSAGVHPTIGDHVTIYANASVLGPITVGDHSVVGSNAWVKEDIPPYSRVLPSGTETKIIQRKPR